MNPNRPPPSFGSIPRKQTPGPQQQSQGLLAASGPQSLPTIPRRPSSGSNLPSVPRKSSNAHSLPQISHRQNTAPTLSSVPRKAKGKPNPRRLPLHGTAQPSTQRRAQPSRMSNDKHVAIKSEFPFVIRIKTISIPISNGGIPHSRTSSREQKRKRPTYQELADTDSDDFLSDSSDEGVGPSTNKRLKKLTKTATPPEPANNAASFGIPAPGGTTLDALMPDVTDPNSVEAPPPGVLASLWYSRENVLHIWVLEKILSWKKRSVVSLQWKTDEDGPKSLAETRAKDISNKLLENNEFCRNSKKRMEVSRINAQQCPMVMHAAAKFETTKENPAFVVAPSNPDLEEEVLLVKWRGRSYVHCSWERRKDIEKFDLSNNTARNKIKRFYQNQEVAYGLNWRSVLDSERTAPIMTEGGTAEANTGIVHEEELFPPQNLEIERLLACDESDMDMKIFAKQRLANMKAEEEAVKQREQEETEGKLHKQEGLFDSVPLVPEEEQKWDPEDYVRYVVKWKGLQYSDVYWEYWKDIKRDAVNQAEDFWYRQKSPDPEDVRRLNQRPHPHIREFRKLEHSPIFGTSNRIRQAGDGTQLQQSNGSDEDKDAHPGFRLRSYQLEGVNWLLFNWWNKRSCILADEMGLGKTIQSVCFLHQLHYLQATQVRGPFLIVAPLSLISQWQSESQTWAPDLNIIFYHGSADAREFLVQQEFYFTDQFTSKANVTKLRKHHVTKFHILITTYEVVLKDISVLSKVKWKALIVDEAHRLKNPKARLFEELASVPRDFCLLLTGTPLQNSTEELWALLHFSDPVTFKSKEDFVEKFGQLQDSKQVSDLHAVLKPYLLRRVKEDVEKSLPPKEETILEVTLTPIQKAYYKAIYERNTTFLFKGSKPSNAPSLMNVMMELRKACNHPFLIKGAEERILADAVSALREKTDQNTTTGAVDHVKLFGDQLIKSSGKMVLLAKLLPKLFDGGHKVLVFSQMVRVLDLLEELLKLKKYRYERLDGSTTASSRAAAVDRFIRKSCKRFVMLLSTRAGGLGLNLTAADTVIIFDSDWNPQNDLQAMARAHRIGQTKAVRVYRLLTAKTYEMHMFHSASMKLGLSGAVLAQQREERDDGKKSERGMQAKEIDELLKKGAYDVFRDDDDKEAQHFMETDIDSLLQQSAKTVTYGKPETSISSGLGSFSKASFVADTEDGGKDVDLDDPDFWKKAVGLDAPVETPEELKQMIDDGVKRSRKQVIQYDPYAAFAEAEQKKKDKIALKEKEEKEERARLRMEKRKKKEEERERKRREREDKEGKKPTNPLPSASPPIKKETLLEVKAQREPKVKKAKRSERSKASRRAENEDPPLERLRQAWDVPQRNRATSGLIRFGFGRFCKLRNDVNLTSLPTHDLEVFARQFVFQIGLFIGVSLTKQVKRKIGERGSPGMPMDASLRHLIYRWLGWSTKDELVWICESIQSALALQLEVDDRRRSLRLPPTLRESDYANDMSKGPALRALRRIGILARFTAIMEDVLDSILAPIGAEEAAKRSCLGGDLSALDADLKMRFVTREELSLALAGRLSRRVMAKRAPAAWWSKKCDLALLIGTFVHGFGNYDAMKNDVDLPFARTISKHMNADEGCRSAVLMFKCAVAGTRKVFDDALESSKVKSQLEGYAAVAAAVAATKKAETEEAIKDATSGVTEAVSSLDIESDDLHMVTLPRFSKRVVESVRQRAKGSSDAAMTDATEGRAEESSSAPAEEKGRRKRSLENEKLYMPDARILDARVLDLVADLEGHSNEFDPTFSSTSPISLWEQSESVSSARFVFENVRNSFVEIDPTFGGEFYGIGINGYQCGAVHKSLDDGTDYSFCSASAELLNVAQGNDAPRYLRAIGVPITISRYAISSMVHADPLTVEKMVELEKARNFPEKPPRTTAQSSNGSLEKEGIRAAQLEGLERDSAKLTKEELGKGIEEGMNEATRVNDLVSPSLSLVVSAPREAEGAQERGAEEEVLVADPLPSYPSKLIPSLFRDNPSLRASICTVALYFGVPSGCVSQVDASLMQSLTQHLHPALESVVFTFEKFACEVRKLTNSGLPDEVQMKEYISSLLLPHCLRLCLSGNGPTTRSTRVSKGTFEAAYGICMFQEPFNSVQHPLPDPTASASEHSIEAVLAANAILRRVRLIRAAQYAVSGAVPLEDLTDIFTSPVMSRSMHGLPLWWNPSIHDLGLLVGAATGGIFAVVRTRENTVFAPSVIERQIRSVAPTLPDDWVQAQVAKFPTANLLERRLALICSEITKHLETEAFYCHIPMFDHGGWPRN